MRSNYKKQHGITLIEVLVAAIILFMAFSLASLSFKATINNFQSALEQESIIGYYPFIQRLVRQELKDNPNKQKGQFYYDTYLVKYEAERVQSKNLNKNNTASGDEFTLLLPFILNLYDIKITINGKSFQTQQAIAFKI